MLLSRKPILLALTGLLAATGLAACASTPGAATFDEAEVVSTSLSSYERIYVADVKVSDELKERTKRNYRARFNRDEDRPISERDLNRKAKDLKKAMKRELGKTRDLASAPGPGVLTVEATLTDLRSNRPTQADLAQEPGLSFQSRYAGGASATFVLSSEGQELGRLSDRISGDLQPPLPVGTWEEVDRAFYRWSRNLSATINNG